MSLGSDNLSPTKAGGQIVKAIFLCFFISGAAGLIYEILWIRMLGLIFGHTVHAITTVLVAFMAGLGLGAYVCGHAVNRVRSLLRLYGLLEIGIGLYCLLIPWLMELIKVFYLTLARSFEFSFSSLTLVQFVLSAAVLVFPTTLMGATLPVLSRFFVRDIGTVGQRVGTLYAFNTFGAVIGTYLAGFELLPMMGMQLTLLFTVTLNIGVGLLVILFNRRLGILTEPNSERADEPAIKPQTGPSFFSWPHEAQWVVLVFAFSGAASMIYEIAWTRALSLVIGSSTYAFSAMLLSFLIGIAAGSAVFARFVKKAPITCRWFAGLQLIIGASAAVVLPLIDRMPDLFLAAFRISQSYSFILIVQVLISFAIMILPTLFIGATFPMAVHLLSKKQSSVGFDVGRIYSFNTAGAILGSFAAGFILVPLIGVQSTIKVAIMMNLAAGLAHFLVFDKSRLLRTGASMALVAAAVGVVLIPEWDKQVMASGASIRPEVYIRDQSHPALHDLLRDRKMLFYKDGVSATVTVYGQGKDTFLQVNGKTDASTTLDMHTQLMSGHLPALLHPNPKTALVIGLGSGVTVGALTQHDLEKIDVVEIEPAVIEAQRYFASVNRNAVLNPKVNVIVADGRNFLLMSPNKYDLIISEPSNPWVGGIATLFTVEFFELARQHLSPHGMMVQWFHGYAMSPENVQMVLASFRSVFPHATLWMTVESDYLLVGSQEPLTVDLDRVRSVYEKNAALRQDLQSLKLLSAETLVSDFMLDEHDLGRYSQSADLNTDDRLPLEFSAPRSLYEDTSATNGIALRKAKQEPYPKILGKWTLDEPEVHYQFAIALINNKRFFGEALDHLDAALSKNPQFVPARVERARLRILGGRVLEATDDLQTAIKEDPRSADAYHLLGLIYLRQNKVKEAIEAMNRAVRLEGSALQYLVDLAAAYRQAKEYEYAVAYYRRALTRDPNNLRIMGALGATWILLKKPDDAIEVLGKAIAIDSRDPRLHFHLGQAYLLLNQDEKAQKSFEAAITLGPGDAEPYVGLGKTWLALGDRGKALVYFKKAMSLNPRITVPEV
jgi:spermidine synthase